MNDDHGTSLRPLRGEPRALTADILAWLEAEAPGPISVRTSGSTGEPKDVVLSRGAVLASARATHDRLGGPGRWLLALAPHYVAGLQVVVRSWLAGQAPVAVDDDPAEALASVHHGNGPAYAALVPTQLRRWLDDPRLAEGLAALDAVLIGGSALPGDLAAAARDAGVRVVSTYGMSETCGGCVYDGVPLDGVAVALSPEGCIRIAGPVVFDGYDGQASGGPNGGPGGGWFHTHDLGEFDLDGRLRVVGRADDVVISGGVNVPLPRVQEALRAAPGVRDALVVGVDDAEWGTRVAALVVGDGLTRERVRDAVSGEVPRAWAPQQVLSVPDLPWLPTGKPDLRRARTWLTDAGEAP